MSTERKFKPGETVKLINTGEHAEFVRYDNAGTGCFVFLKCSYEGPVELRYDESGIEKVEIVSPFEVGDRVEMIQDCCMATVTDVCLKKEDEKEWFSICVHRDDTDTNCGPYAPCELRKIESTMEPAVAPVTSAMDIQVDGDHYKKMGIQPIDYALQNDLNAVQFSIVKHATRYPHKGEAITDLKKVIHYAQIALERQYNVLSQISYQEPM